MSEEKVTLELLGARLMALTADVRDLQQRFAGIEARLGVVEARLSGLEARFGVQEERMTRMLALIVRIAERVGGAAE
jgi:hypothetical protein